MLTPLGRRCENSLFMQCEVVTSVITVNVAASATVIVFSPPLVSVSPSGIECCEQLPSPTVTEDGGTQVETAGAHQHHCYCPHPHFGHHLHGVGLSFLICMTGARVEVTGRDQTGLEPSAQGWLQCTVTSWALHLWTRSGWYCLPHRSVRICMWDTVAGHD